MWGTGLSALYIMLMAQGKLLIFGSDGYEGTTDWYWAVETGPIMVVVIAVILVLSSRKVLTTVETVTWLALGIIPALTIPLKLITDLPILHFFMALASLLVYINIHIEQSIRLVAKEAENTELRMKVMLSQIQPHFMYNSLNSIYYLIGKEPKKAQDALSTFSDYQIGRAHV